MSTARTAFRYLVIAMTGVVWMSLANRALAIDPHGRPDGFENRHGFCIWIDDEGRWCMALVPVRDRGRTVTGTIRVIGAQIEGATGVSQLEGGDYWKIDGVKNTVSFKLSAKKGGRDVIRLILKGPARELKFDLKPDGDKGKTKWIQIGRKGECPKSYSFTLSGK